MSGFGRDVVGSLGYPRIQNSKEHETDGCLSWVLEDELSLCQMSCLKQ